MWLFIIFDTIWMLNVKKKYENYNRKINYQGKWRLQTSNDDRLKIKDWIAYQKTRSIFDVLESQNHVTHATDKIGRQILRKVS